MRVRIFDTEYVVDANGKVQIALLDGTWKLFSRNKEEIGFAKAMSSRIELAVAKLQRGRVRRARPPAVALPEQP